MKIIVIEGNSSEEIARIEAILESLPEESCEEGCECGDCPECQPQEDDVCGCDICKEKEESCGEDCCGEGCECGDCPACEKSLCSCGCEDCDCDDCGDCQEYGGGECLCECEGCSKKEEDIFEFDLDIGEVDMAIENIKNAALYFKLATELMAESKRESMVEEEIRNAIESIDTVADILAGDVEVDEDQISNIKEDWKVLAVNFRDMVFTAEEEDYLDLVVDTLQNEDYRQVLEKIGEDEELAEIITEAEEVISEDDKDYLNELIIL